LIEADLEINESYNSEEAFMRRFRLKSGVYKFTTLPRYLI